MKVKGLYTKDGGYSYDGEFKNDLKHGYGIEHVDKKSSLFATIDLDEHYDGYWKNDMRDG